MSQNSDGDSAMYPVTVACVVRLKEADRSIGSEAAARRVLPVRTAPSPLATNLLPFLSSAAGVLLSLAEHWPCASKLWLYATTEHICPTVAPLIFAAGHRPPDGLQACAADRKQTH